MYGTQPARRQISFGIGPVPRDLIVLLCVLFSTYTLDAFVSTRPLVSLLQLSPAVWQNGFLWQIATYPFAESFSGIWFLLIGFMILQFGGQVFRAMGRKAFWRMLLIASIAGALAAVAAQLAIGLLGLGTPLLVPPFLMMQGGKTILAILIAAFSTLFANATIYFMFILPIRAGWFLWLEILLAFIGFLGTKDFGGFVGLTTAVGATYFLVSGRGFGRWLREVRLRAERKLLESKLKRMQAKAKGGRTKSAPDDDSNVRKGPWIH